MTHALTCATICCTMSHYRLAITSFYRRCCSNWLGLQLHYSQSKTGQSTVLTISSFIASNIGRMLILILDCNHYPDGPHCPTIVSSLVVWRQGCPMPRKFLLQYANPCITYCVKIGNTHMFGVYSCVGKAIKLSA